MEFKNFRQRFNDNLSQILDEDHLFVVAVDKDLMWNTYLDSFPPGTNLVFRKRREHDCSCCRQFIRSFGNVVCLREGKIISIWDFESQSPEFQPVMDAMSKLVKSSPLQDHFVTKDPGFGTETTRELVEGQPVRTWDHFYVKVPSRFIDKSKKSIESVQAEIRDTKNVFKRSLSEITEDAVAMVLELIHQNSLYKGEEWKSVLTSFLTLQKTFNVLAPEIQDSFCWIKSLDAGPVIGRIRNHSIGTLLQDLSKDVDLNEAVRKYEALVAPSNYKRPKAVFTKKMLEQAQEKLQELGLFDSLGRRHATLDDITVNNILFSNKDSAKRIKGSVFDEMSQDLGVNPKSFDKIEEVPISDFVEKILPDVKVMELLLENRHAGNLFSLIAPINKDSKSMFKWNNGFSWAYNGNITDSMKEKVKAAGGNVDGVLRFSIQWNSEADNRDDLDAHCFEPNKNYIEFRNKGVKHPSSGMLDVDIIHPEHKEVAVENITWTDKTRMKEGVYEFAVHCYTSRGGKSGFSAEIEYEGQIHSFEYPQPLHQSQFVVVAKVKFSKTEGIKFVESLPSTTSSRSLWGVSTNQFHPVSVVMFSPNYWDSQTGIGNRHYFFVVKNCVNDSEPNGFFNEFLNNELMAHKRVFEALGNKMRVEPSEDQMSGLGFSSTKRESLVCRVQGKISRTLKILF